MEERGSGNQLKALSLSYLEAPIDVREVFSFDEAQTKELLLHLRDVKGIHEAFLISTCNRTELYYNHDTAPVQVLKALAAYKGVQSADVQAYFHFFSEPSDAIRHLFRVGVGLESQVLGDLQIINQVKNAYQWCADINMAGAYLHRLLHSIFFANKRVVQETNFRSGSASVSYATKELASDLVVDKNLPITIYGLGEIGLPVLKNLLDEGYSNITVCNRSAAKVEPFMQTHGVRFLPFEQWTSGLSATLIISALSGSVLKIEPQHIQNCKVLGFRYLIDLGLPRSIQPSVGEEDGVVLYNLDQIQSKVSAALEIRRKSIPQVEIIVEEASHEFEEWTREMSVSPVIHLMKNSLEQIRQEEMARFLKKANQEQVTWAEDLTKNLMQRIMKTHVVALKAACKRDEADKLVDVLHQLFNIQEQTKA